MARPRQSERESCQHSTSNLDHSPSRVLRERLTGSSSLHATHRVTSHMLRPNGIPVFKAQLHQASYRRACLSALPWGLQCRCRYYYTWMGESPASRPRRTGTLHQPQTTINFHLLASHCTLSSEQLRARQCYSGAQTAMVQEVIFMIEGITLQIDIFRLVTVTSTSNRNLFGT